MIFIHGSFSHLINNTISLSILLLLKRWAYPKLFYRLIFFIILICGIWLWAAARPSYHIGASALIYGMAGFLIVSGFIRKNIKLLRMSLLVIFLNGGMIWGMLPFVKEDISWEGHLFGALSGILLAFYYKDNGPKNDQFSWDLYPESENYEEEFWKIPSSETTSEENAKEL